MTGILLKYAVKNGMDSKKLCNGAGIDPSFFKESDARISVAQFNSIWEAVEKQSGRSDFGLDFGRELAINYHSGHILFAVMMNSPTVGTAMGKFIKYHNLMADAVGPVWSVRLPIVMTTLSSFVTVSLVGSPSVSPGELSVGSSSLSPQPIKTLPINNNPNNTTESILVIIIVIPTSSNVELNPKGPNKGNCQNPK